MGGFAQYSLIRGFKEGSEWVCDFHPTFFGRLLKKGHAPFLIPQFGAAEIRFPLKSSRVNAWICVREANFNSLLEVHQAAMLLIAVGDRCRAD